MILEKKKVESSASLPTVYELEQVKPKQIQNVIPDGQHEEDEMAQAEAQAN